MNQLINELCIKFNLSKRSNELMWEKMNVEFARNKGKLKDYLVDFSDEEVQAFEEEFIGGTVNIKRLFEKYADKRMSVDTYQISLDFSWPEYEVVSISFILCLLVDDWAVVCYHASFDLKGNLIKDFIE